MYRTVVRTYLSSSQASLATIYALSTAPTRSAVGVIRVSGPQSDHILKSIAGTIPKARSFLFRKLTSPQTKQLLDHSLVVKFKAPKSFTGEDMAEFHVHGGRATINAVLKAIGSLNDGDNAQIRYAESGEFTRRAFQNGKLDLTEVEAIGQIIDAETETQRVSSIGSMEGYSKKYFGDLREKILQSYATLSALIDFGDDYDIEGAQDIMRSVGQNVMELKTGLQQYLQKAQKTSILLEGVKLTLVGPTNAGKSSLLNSMINKDAAIVSDIAGTTRDALDFPVDINGYKVVIADTAGIRRSTKDSIEMEGIRRAKQKAAESDLVLCVLPITETVDQDLIEYVLLLKDKPLIVALNKLDLVDEPSTYIAEFAAKLHVSESAVIPISCLTGLQISDVVQRLTDSIQDMTTKDPISLSARAQDILANEILFGFERFFSAGDDAVLALDSLGLSIRGIGQVTGDAVDVEEVLGVIFSKFCIGK